MGARPDFTLVQLHYFVTAAELGSMTAASRALLISQSAISTAVAQLERELGVQLLIRHHAKGLALTRAGERFLVSARDLLAHAGQVAETARGLGGELSGDLAVGCFVVLSPFYLPRLLDQFTRRHPGVRVSLFEGELAALQTALLDGRCELALTYDIGFGPDFVTEQLARIAPYVALPPDHPLTGQETVRLAQLAAEPLIMLDLPHSRAYFEGLFAQAGVVPKVRFRTSGYETVRAMVGRGHGVALLDQRPATMRTLDGGMTALRPLADEVPMLSLVLARVRDVRPTRRAEVFAAMARAAVTETGAVDEELRPRGTGR